MMIARVGSMMLLVLVVGTSACSPPTPHERIGTVPPLGPDGALHDLFTSVRQGDDRRLQAILADPLPPQRGSFVVAPPSTEQVATTLRNTLTPLLEGALLETDAPRVTIRYDATGHAEDAIGTARATLVRYTERGETLATWQIDSEWYSEADRWRLTAIRGVRIYSAQAGSASFTIRRRNLPVTATTAPLSR